MVPVAPLSTVNPQHGVLMSSRSFSFITFAGVLILAIACTGDNPAAPSQSEPLSSVIKSDIAASAGNAIASDLETLIANDAAAVAAAASFATLAPTFGVDAPAPSPSNPPSPNSGDTGSSNPSSVQPNCTAGSQPGVFLCLREPGPGDNLKCTYSDEKKLYLCVKQEEPQPTPVPPPSGESCSYNAAALIHSCV